MSLRIALMGLVASGLMGCVAQVGEVPEDEFGEEESGDYKGENINPYKRTSALAGANEFASFTYLTVNGNAATERYADCGVDEVLTGFGARSNSGDVRDVTVYCRHIGTDGQLAAEESPYTNGGPAQEKVIHANTGYVFVGLGGWVTGSSNFGRLTARQCEWDAQTRTVKTHTCSWISTDQSLATELQFDIHARYNSTERYRIVATGAGISESNNNVSEIRLRAGMLRNNTLLNESPLSGGQRYFTVNVPLGAKSVDFRTTITGATQIGDADLYVRKNAQVTGAEFDCRSWNGSNVETCDFDATDASGTYYILLNDYSPYEQVRLTVTYSTVN